MDLIDTYFPNISREQHKALIQYSLLLKEWNQKINLISRKNEDSIEEQHILHALSIAKFIQFKPGSFILDLGTGGGLPGIPLSIMFPKTKFHLVDSIGKKILAVQNMVNELMLPNVTTEQTRVEHHKGSYDFVITRAVAQSQQLIKWSAHLFKTKHQHNINNGILALKGGHLEEELKRLPYKTETIQLSTYFNEAFFDTKKLVYIPMKPNL